MTEGMKLLPAIVALSFLVRLHAVEKPATGFDLAIEAPLDFQVIQRSTLLGGHLVIAGKITPLPGTISGSDELQSRLIGKSSFDDIPEGWQSLPFDAHVGSFRGELHVPAGGWYRVEVRLLHEGETVASQTVEHVGVGEIFVIAGQSNAGNYGEERQKPVSGMVAAFDGLRWQLANDPQPGAGGTKGSFGPLLGDKLAAHFHVPIGFVGTAVGSTSVREWLPPHTPVARLPSITRNILTNREGRWESSGKIFENFTAKMNRLGTNGFRAVLWHQGESDARQANPERTLPGGLYQQYLEQLIRDSRQVTGWNAPWFVAQASYHSPGDPASPDIRAAQKSAWTDGVALQGPDTDSLVGSMREKNGTGVHLSAAGLKAHAHLWFEQVAPWLDTLLEAERKNRTKL
jgi:hypothetical protein